VKTARLVRTAAVVVVAVVAWLTPAGAERPADTLPDRLTDQEFWRLSQELSEPNGFFQSDNLVSNEIFYPYIVADLIARTKPGGVYLGVGPDQNFNYIVATKPKIVFINDIRRGNLHAQLMYKALFELSADRVEFMSRLFTRTKPPNVNASSTAAELSEGFWSSSETVIANDNALYKSNLQAILDHLTKTHSLPLGREDLDGITYIYNQFYWHGPRITYSSSTSTNPNAMTTMPTYGDLIMATDAQGVFRGYLASEATFKIMKDLESRNLVIPVVGDFAGPKALRAIGAWVRERGGTITAFYLSNVEQYLQRSNVWFNFCANVASMPLTAESTFIRSVNNGSAGGRLVNTLGAMQTETAGCR
jgi:hypothetical protein